MTTPVTPSAQGVPAPPGALDLGEWRHLHPLSPILKGGVVLIAVLGFVISQSFDRLVRGLGPDSWTAPWEWRGERQPAGGTSIEVDPAVYLLTHPLILGLLGLLLVGVFVAALYLAWRFAKFRVHGGQVELRSGIVFRQHRQVALDRVQAVEISRPLLARAVGLSQVIVQSAGGGDSQLKLAFLSAAEATLVRDHLLRLVAGTSDARPAGTSDARPAGSSDARPAGTSGARPAGSSEGAAGGIPADPFARNPYAAHDPFAPTDPGREVLAVPNGRLFLATVLHPASIVAIGTLIVAIFIFAGLRFGPLAFLGLPALVPILFGTGAHRARELLRHGNFRIADQGSNLRLSHGFTDLRTTTVPLHRVQALELVQPIWWRPFGWWRVEANVAGTQHGGEDGMPQDSTAVLPVGTLADALLVLTLVDPRLEREELARGVTGSGTAGGWVLAFPAARAIDPWTVGRIGYAVTEEAVLVRRGRFTLRLVVVPHARIQSLELTQGVVQRRVGVASVALHSTPGPVVPVIEHLSLADAQAFLREESRRAARARSAPAGAVSSAASMGQPPCESVPIAGELDSSA